MTRHLFAVTLCTAAFAQTFEVASIRLHPTPLNIIEGYSASGNRVEYEAWTSSMLIMEAYHLKRYQIAFPRPPHDSDTDYYDIVAKAEGDAPRTRADFRGLLQALLAERFQLRFHYEDREIPCTRSWSAKTARNLSPAQRMKSITSTSVSMVRTSSSKQRE